MMLRRRLRMKAVTYAPSKLLELRQYLKPWTGLPDTALGIIGDENHIGGYHHGWDDRRIVNGNTADYSWNESTRDDYHRTNAASAIDIGMFSRLRELSNWLVGQCEANRLNSSVNTDCADIRSIIYSPDGKVVRRWDRLRRRDTGDSSHLTHTHVSFFRNAEGHDKTGPFKRFFEGDGMEQTDPLTAKTYRPGTTVGEAFGDMQNRRNWLIGETESPVHGDASGTFPRQGSPDWNIAHLPQLLAEHASAPVDPAALAAIIKPMLDAMEARLRQEIRDSVADLGEGGAKQVRGLQ